ncbi:hypothetical protein KKD52_06020 [Myxococcota bacterium]|nr:hypothetical protein [Myxococcota bacterium]MBU1410082.1 hypothetical protein [Myxococcota bacterium]MBU1509899.1 hypothetical protein [Myxococcota bacterium]
MRLIFLPLVTAVLLLGCDSPHRRPPTDVGPDVDIQGDDQDRVDDIDLQDVPDSDVSDGWPPRNDCTQTPINGINVGQNNYFFSVPFTRPSNYISLTESGIILFDQGRCSDVVNGINAWFQDIYSYSLFQREEEELVIFPAPQTYPHEYHGKVYFSSSYVDYHVNPNGNPWEGNPNIWVWDRGLIENYSTWCPPETGCTDQKISKSGKMIYFQYEPNASPLLVQIMFHDLETLETREVFRYTDSPITFAIGDRAIFWNYGPCGSFRYYDIERDEIVENTDYQTFVAIAWGKYLAWSNCSPLQEMVLNVETGEYRNLDEELNQNPETRNYSIHTGYENLVAFVDRAREVPEPGQAAHLWIYDLDTRTERRITSEAAKWTWGGFDIINCTWAIVALDYGKNGTLVNQYPRSALNLQEAGILDANCHVIPGPPVEFTLEEFILASGFTLEGYNPLYD